MDGLEDGTVKLDMTIVRDMYDDLMDSLLSGPLPHTHTPARTRTHTHTNTHTHIHTTTTTKTRTHTHIYIYPPQAHTHRSTHTLIYFNTDTQYANFLSNDGLFTCSRGGGLSLIHI